MTGRLTKPIFVYFSKRDECPLVILIAIQVAVAAAEGGSNRQTLTEKCVHDLATCDPFKL